MLSISLVTRLHWEKLRLVQTIVDTMNFRLLDRMLTLEESSLYMPEQAKVNELNMFTDRFDRVVETVASDE